MQEILGHSPQREFFQAPVAAYALLVMDHQIPFGYLAQVCKPRQPRIRGCAVRARTEDLLLGDQYQALVGQPESARERPNQNLQRGAGRDSLKQV